MVTIRDMTEKLRSRQAHRKVVSLGEKWLPAFLKPQEMDSDEERKEEG